MIRIRLKNIRFSIIAAIVAAFSLANAQSAGTRISCKGGISSVVERNNQRLMTPVKEYDKERQEEFVEIFKNEGLEKAAVFVAPKRSLINKVLSRMKKILNSGKKE